jgi:hemerythrin
MSVFEWNDRYSIGDRQCDEQHQHLFQLMARTFDDFVNQAPFQELDPLLDELIDYATYHFSAEEQAMREHRFPALSMHEKEHELFSRRVAKMQDDYHRGKKHLLLEILSFLHNWLQTHILNSDAEFGRFMVSEKYRKFETMKGRKLSFESTGEAANPKLGDDLNFSSNR